MEEKLWTMGILGDSDPATLVNTMVYVFGLHFALRGRDEHRRLRRSQLTVRVAADGRRYIEYHEDVSKSRSGGLKTFNRPVKVTQAYELTECPQRCPVRLYELYTSKCPVVADRVDAFYLRPLEKYRNDCWYYNSPIGQNTLWSIVSKMCARAGFKGFYSNHSLRATAATRLFSANVDEQLIKLKTGHSSDAVRSYKRVSDEQLSGMTDIISSKCAKAEKPVELNNKTVELNVASSCSSSPTDLLGGLFSNCQFAGTVHVNISR